MTRIRAHPTSPDLAHSCPKTWVTNLSTALPHYRSPSRADIRSTQPISRRQVDPRALGQAASGPANLASVPLGSREAGSRENPGPLFDRCGTCERSPQHHATMRAPLGPAFELCDCPSPCLGVDGARPSLRNSTEQKLPTALWALGIARAGLESLKPPWPHGTARSSLLGSTVCITLTAGVAVATAPHHSEVRSLPSLDTCARNACGGGKPGLPPDAYIFPMSAQVIPPCSRSRRSSSEARPSQPPKSE